MKFPSLKHFHRKQFAKRFVSEEDGCTMIRNHLTSGKPAAHIATGDGDLLWLAYPEISSDPDNQIFPLDPSFPREGGLGGFNRVSDASLRKFYRDAVRACPYFCLSTYRHRDKLSWWALEACGLYDDRPHIPYPCTRSLNYYDCFFPILEGKRIFIIAGYAIELSHVLSCEDYQQPNNYEITGYITAPGRKSNSKVAFVKDMKLKLEAVADTFDVLIAAAGASSIILCDHVRQLGKVGFDIGATDLHILGKKSSYERWNWDVPKHKVRKKR